MRKILPLLLSFLLLFSTPSVAKEQGHFVAVIASPDLAYYWSNWSQINRDALVPLHNWDSLEKVLIVIRDMAGNSDVFLDFHVHGNDSGLVLREENESRYDRASFGYVLNRFQKVFQGKRVYLVFESCRAGAAYKKTIRGAHPERPADNIEDYAGVPPFPVYGAGDSFSCIGQIMYLQWKHHFRRWWVNLIDYDPLGKNRALASEEPRVTVLEMKDGKLKTTEIQKTTLEQRECLYAIRQHLLN